MGTIAYRWDTDWGGLTPYLTAIRWPELQVRKSVDFASVSRRAMPKTDT